MTAPSIIVVQSESWRDTARLKKFRFRTGLHLFQGQEAPGTPLAGDRVVVWRHAQACTMRDSATLHPLWQDQGGDTFACAICLAEPILYDRRRPSVIWRGLAWVLARGLGLRVYRHRPEAPGLARDEKKPA